jgi:hypothetical protein
MVFQQPKANRPLSQTLQYLISLSLSFNRRQLIRSLDKGREDEEGISNGSTKIILIGSQVSVDTFDRFFRSFQKESPFMKQILSLY